MPPSITFLFNWRHLTSHITFLFKWRHLSSNVTFQFKWWCHLPSSMTFLFKWRHLEWPIAFLFKWCYLASNLHFLKVGLKCHCLAVFSYSGVYFCCCFVVVLQYFNYIMAVIWCMRWGGENLSWHFYRPKQSLTPTPYRHGVRETGLWWCSKLYSGEMDCSWAKYYGSYGIPIPITRVTNPVP